MKKQKIVRIIAIFFLAAILFACATDPKKPERTEIPEELKTKKNVVEFFATLEEIIDEYANLIESLIDMAEDIEKKKDAANIADAMNMLTQVATMVIKIAPLIERLEELEKESDKFEESLTAQEFEIFIKTYGKIMLRFYEIAKKAEEKGY